MEKSIGGKMNNNNLSDSNSYSKKEWSVRDARMLSPLQLAYVGDAVYEVYIRTYLIQNKDIQVNKLHKEAVKYVKAEAQASTIHSIWDELTDEERSIVKRGRNTKSGSVPKNASISDYRYATGFEAMIGYLYLLDRKSRIEKIIGMIVYAEGC